MQKLQLLIAATAFLTSNAFAPLYEALAHSTTNSGFENAYFDLNIAFGGGHSKEIVAKDWTGFTNDKGNVQMSGETKVHFLERPTGLLGLAEGGIYTSNDFRVGILGYHHINVKDRVMHAPGVTGVASERDLQYDTTGAMLQLSYESTISNRCNFCMLLPQFNQ